MLAAERRNPTRVIGVAPHGRPRAPWRAPGVRAPWRVR